MAVTAKTVAYTKKVTANSVNRILLVLGCKLFNSVNIDAENYIKPGNFQLAV